MSSISNIFLYTNESEVDQLTLKKNSYFVKRKTAYIGLVLISILFIGILLVVYNSAKSQNQAQNCTNTRVAYTTTINPTASFFDSNINCKNAVCQKQKIAMGK